MKLHSTTIVGNNVELGKDVIIGPYTIINDNVSIGDGTVIGTHCYIDSNTNIGKNNKIGVGVIIGTPPQDKKYKDEKTFTKIGDNNIIREYVTINRGCGENSTTYVGDNNYLMISSHIGHNAVVGSNCVLTNNVALAGHTAVEDYVILAGNAVVAQFVRIGKMAMVGGLSGVRKDIPPFALASGFPARIYGINAIGLRRNEVPAETCKELKNLYHLIFFIGKNFSDALAEAKHLAVSEEAKHLINFFNGSKKGVCPAVRKNELKEEELAL